MQPASNATAEPVANAGGENTSSSGSMLPLFIGIAIGAVSVGFVVWVLIRRRDSRPSAERNKASIGPAPPPSPMQPRSPTVGHRAPMTMPPFSAAAVGTGSRQAAASAGGNASAGTRVGYVNTNTNGVGNGVGNQSGNSSPSDRRITSPPQPAAPSQPSWQHEIASVASIVAAQNPMYTPSSSEHYTPAYSSTVHTVNKPYNQQHQQPSLPAPSYQPLQPLPPIPRQKPPPQQSPPPPPSQQQPSQQQQQQIRPKSQRLSAQLTISTAQAAPAWKSANLNVPANATTTVNRFEAGPATNVSVSDSGFASSSSQYASPASPHPKTQAGRSQRAPLAPVRTFGLETSSPSSVTPLSPVSRAIAQDMPKYKLFTPTTTTPGTTLGPASAAIAAAMGSRLTFRTTSSSQTSLMDTSIMSPSSPRSPMSASFPLPQEVLQEVSQETERDQHEHEQLDANRASAGLASVSAETPSTPTTSGSLAVYQPPEDGSRAPLRIGATQLVWWGYEAKRDDELSVWRGDMVRVNAVFDDGWVMVTTKDGIAGVIPMACLNAAYH
ncbi:hypothetical protein BC831DRAFT_476517 [Entophlyctis helioformis]|nr:hypothetical protein BC831DRAFT_476517 [Entophlyctis helioformis]